MSANANIVVGRITEECENMLPIQTSIETSVHFLCCKTANVTQKIEYTLVQRRPETSATFLYNHFISISHTAMMWQTEPARTKKWKTVCMKRRLRRQ